MKKPAKRRKPRLPREWAEVDRRVSDALAGSPGLTFLHLAGFDLKTGQLALRVSLDEKTKRKLYRYTMRTLESR